MSVLRNILAVCASLVALILSVPVIAVGFPFMAVALVVRAVATRLEPKCIRWPEIFEFDSTLGWKTTPNLNCYCLDERDDTFHIVTDEEGWPGSRTVENSDIVVFGDSHAFGYGVDHEKSFSQVEKGVRIKAIGVPGYNMVQELMLLERLAPRLHLKMVVWFCYIGNDLFDNLSPEMSGYRAPFLRQSRKGTAWEVVTSHLAPEPWTCSVGAKALRKSGYPLIPGLHSDTILSRRAYSACEHLIEQGQQVCGRNGARLAVVSIPEPFALDSKRVATARMQYPSLNQLDSDYPDTRLREMCGKLGVRFLALKDHLELSDYKTSHDHWTERGHRRVAKVLSDLYRDQASDAELPPSWTSHSGRLIAVYDEDVLESKTCSGSEDSSVSA